MTVAIGVMLAVAVAAAWLGAAGFARLATPLERLHVVAFVNVVAGAFMTLAAFLADGASSRSTKVLLIWLATLIAGSLLSHAVGRTIHVREGAQR